eukprot:m.131104 g.131104  ORF g.131104 m.131104 type:complete len:425 (-) comp23717_c0_seq8:34-1308(-)
MRLKCINYAWRAFVLEKKKLGHPSVPWAGLTSNLHQIADSIISRLEPQLFYIWGRNAFGVNWDFEITNYADTDCNPKVGASLSCWFLPLEARPRLNSENGGTCPPDYQINQSFLRFLSQVFSPNSKKSRIAPINQYFLNVVARGNPGAKGFRRPKRQTTRPPPLPSPPPVDLKPEDMSLFAFSVSLVDYVFQIRPGGQLDLAVSNLHASLDMHQFQPFLAVHIRRADKVKDEISPYSNEDWVNIVKLFGCKYEISNFFLASDDDAIFEYLKDRLPQFEFKWAPKKLQTFAFNAGREGGSNGTEFLAELEVMADSQCFIGQTSSNVARWVIERMGARVQEGVPCFEDLDFFISQDSIARNGKWFRQFGRHSICRLDQVPSLYSGYPTQFLIQGCRENHPIRLRRLGNRTLISVLQEKTTLPSQCL